MPVNHQLQEVGFLFSHILLPLFCKWIRIWLVSLFTVYLSRAISKHLKGNIGSEPKPDSHARKNSLVGQPPGLFPFLQPEYFLTLAKFLPPSKAKLKAKLLPLSKQNFLFPLSHSAWNSYPCCTSRSFLEKKPLTQRKCKADGFSTYVQGGRRERMKF